VFVINGIDSTRCYKEKQASLLLRRLSPM